MENYFKLKHIKLALIILINFVSINQLSFSQTDMQLLKAMSSSNSPTINVAIGGNFITTGSFGAQINERVDQFVTRIFNEAKVSLYQTAKSEIMVNEIEKKLSDYGLRDIKLKRISGETLSIDLLMFRTNGDYSNNPYLKNDDVIIFPTVDLERGFFSVEGAVNLPGKFQFVDEDNLQTALELAHGIHKAYNNINHIEIIRLNYLGNQMTKINAAVNDVIPLERGDQVRVIADETNKKAFTVAVLGEVKSPGYVPITKNSTDLKNVIENAGGFTEDAEKSSVHVFKSSIFPPGFFERFFNVEVGKPKHLFDKEIFDYFEKIDEFRMYRMSSLENEDTSYFFGESRYKALFNGRTYNLSSNQNNDSEDGNHILNDGDIVLVRQKETSVYVLGQVSNPGPIHHKAGEGWDYYINKSGGKTKYSRDDIAVIKGGTREWLPIDGNKTITIEPGDYIWIPREPVYTFDYYVWRFGNYVGILGSVATIVLLMFQLTK